MIIALKTEFNQEQYYIIKNLYSPPHKNPIYLGLTVALYKRTFSLEAHMHCKTHNYLYYLLVSSRRVPGNNMKLLEVCSSNIFKLWLPHIDILCLRHPLDALGRFLWRFENPKDRKEMVWRPSISPLWSSRFSCPKDWNHCVDDGFFIKLRAKTAYPPHKRENSPMIDLLYPRVLVNKSTQNFLKSWGKADLFSDPNKIRMLLVNRKTSFGWLSPSLGFLKETKCLRRK